MARKKPPPPRPEHRLNLGGAQTTDGAARARARAMRAIERRGADVAVLEPEDVPLPEVSPALKRRRLGMIAASHHRKSRP